MTPVCLRVVTLEVLTTYNLFIYFYLFSWKKYSRAPPWHRFMLSVYSFKLSCFAFIIVTINYLIKSMFVLNTKGFCKANDSLVNKSSNVTLLLQLTPFLTSVMAFPFYLLLLFIRPFVPSSEFPHHTPLNSSKTKEYVQIQF